MARGGPGEPKVAAAGPPGLSGPVQYTAGQGHLLDGPPGDDAGPPSRRRLIRRPGRRRRVHRQVRRDLHPAAVDRVGRDHVPQRRHGELLQRVALGQSGWRRPARPYPAGSRRRWFGRRPRCRSRRRPETRTRRGWCLRCQISTCHLESPHATKDGSGDSRGGSPGMGRVVELALVSSSRGELWRRCRGRGRAGVPEPPSDGECHQSLASPCWNSLHHH